MGKVLEKIPFVGPVLYIADRQVLFFSPDQHNNYDHYSAGFTSFHRKEEIRGWYAGWDDVAVRDQGGAAESIYAQGARPFTGLTIIPSPVEQQADPLAAPAPA